MTSKKKVLIYRNQLLPISETFIQQQASKLKKWEFLFVGRSVVENGINISEHARLILHRKKGIGDRVLRIFRKMANIPETSEVKLLKKENPSLIHAHFGPDSLEIAAQSSLRESG